MLRHLSTLVSGIIVFFAFSMLSGCSESTSQDKGLLAGTISIGPLCPVETVPPSPGCLPTLETYKAYPVSIWTSDGSRRITLISPSLDGYFSIELDPGEYLIRQDRSYGIGASNLPIEVMISSQETSTVGIKIDTGIR